MKLTWEDTSLEPLGNISPTQAWQRTVAMHGNPVCGGRKDIPNVITWVPGSTVPEAAKSEASVIRDTVLCSFAQSHLPLCDHRHHCPWGCSRQEYWSELPSSPPAHLPNPGIEPRSPALQVDSLPSEPPGKPKNTGVRSLLILQGIFPTQELNWGFLYCRQILYQGSPQEPLASIFGIHQYKLIFSCLLLKILNNRNVVTFLMWDPEVSFLTNATILTNWWESDQRETELWVEALESGPQHDFCGLCGTFAFVCFFFHKIVKKYILYHFGINLYFAFFNNFIVSIIFILQNELSHLFLICLHFPSDYPGSES